MNGIDPDQETLDLWNDIESEVGRLTSSASNGSFSENFAVNRVVTSLAKLKNAQNSPQAARQPSNSRPQGELTVVRQQLVSEQRRLDGARQRLDDAEAQVAQAQEAQRQLMTELENEREERRKAGEGHARQWKETTLRSQLCQARLKAMEHEVSQLRNALEWPEGLAEVWEGLVKKLHAEVDVANVEAALAKKELDRQSA